MKLALVMVVAGAVVLLSGLALGVALLWGALAAASVTTMAAGAALMAGGLLGDFEKPGRRR